MGLRSVLFLGRDRACPEYVLFLRGECILHSIFKKGVCVCRVIFLRGERVNVCVCMSVGRCLSEKVCIDCTVFERRKSMYLISERRPPVSPYVFKKGGCVCVGVHFWEWSVCVRVYVCMRDPEAPPEVIDLVIHRHPREVPPVRPPPISIEASDSELSYG